MIERFNDYETTKAYSDYPTLPRGGYVCKIMKAEVKANSTGKYVQVYFDIAEGEYRDFYSQDYKNQQSEDKKWRGNYLLNIPKDDGSERDGWTKRRFKTFTESLEESNPGYHFDWDEQKFKGKIIGGLFNQREYSKRDGSGTAWATNMAQVTTVEKIRSGEFKIPNDKPLKGSSSKSTNTDDLNGFLDVPAGTDDELPF